MERRYAPIVCRLDRSTLAFESGHLMSNNLSANSAGTPWLEYFLQRGGPAQKTLLASFPFTIGRNDTTDLPINSTRVSRQHASILRAGDTYRVRDLDSTNGTFVNGERIEEATLTDGDILMIADVEFTFFSGNAQAPRKTVTQVISFREPDSANLKVGDLLRSVRRLQESVLQASSRVTYQPIVNLATAQPVGFEALGYPAPPTPLSSESDRLILSTHSRLSVRAKESFALIAAQRALTQPELKWFLPLESSDVDFVFVSTLLARLAARLPDRTPIVLNLPDTGVNDIKSFDELYAEIRRYGVGLCYRDFAAGRSRVEDHRKAPPDFIKLSPAMLRGIGHDVNRRAQCEAVVRACRDIGCEAIAVDVDDQQQADVLQRLGCRLGTGKLWATETPAADGRQKPGSPQSISEPELALV
jgi:EAL domain-containing protein (putative c-di-GMP-specific phosphodiesterase class I)